jgi:hypothetical protein
MEKILGLRPLSHDVKIKRQANNAYFGGQSGDRTQKHFETNGYGGGSVSQSSLTCKLFFIPKGGNQRSWLPVP